LSLQERNHDDQTTAATSKRRSNPWLVDTVAGLVDRLDQLIGVFFSLGRRSLRSSSGSALVRGGRRAMRRRAASRNLLKGLALLVDLLLVLGVGFLLLFGRRLRL